MSLSLIFVQRVLNLWILWLREPKYTQLQKWRKEKKIHQFGPALAQEMEHLSSSQMVCVYGGEKKELLNDNKTRKDLCCWYEFIAWTPESQKQQHVSGERKDLDQLDDAIFVFLHAPFGLTGQDVCNNLHLNSFFPHHWCRILVIFFLLKLVFSTTGAEPTTLDLFWSCSK